jgi:hypothetical protein
MYRTNCSPRVAAFATSVISSRLFTLSSMVHHDRRSLRSIVSEQGYIFPNIVHDKLKVLSNKRLREPDIREFVEKYSGDKFHFTWGDVQSTWINSIKSWSVKEMCKFALENHVQWRAEMEDFYDRTSTVTGLSHQENYEVW